MSILFLRTDAKLIADVSHDYEKRNVNKGIEMKSIKDKIATLYWLWKASYWK